MAGNTGDGRTAYPLDRGRVVEVALELLDEVGLDGLSMRRLADRLGVTAASLYWYVRDKNELLALLADSISAEVPLSSSKRPWRAQLEEGARNFRRVARSHRDAARVLAATAPSGPSRLRAIDTLLGVLLHAGFSPADAADAGYLLNVYIVGFMLDETLGASPATHWASSTTLETLEMPEHACLILERGAVNLTIRSAALPALYQMTCEGHPPKLEARDGILRIWQRPGRHDSCELTLSTAVPWELRVNGGVSRLTADLQNLSLSSLRISGGVNQAALQLPPASGTVPLRIDGGVHGLRIERPPTSAIQLQLHRGSSRITLDGLRLGAAGGGTEWESPEYATASDRYHLEMGGDVNDLTVSTAVVEPVVSAGERATTPMPDWLSAVPAGEYPNLAALAAYLENADFDYRFEVGLQILLDGLERRLADGGSAHLSK
jgi:AcrR family transcriptional regulator